MIIVTSLLMKYYQGASVTLERLIGSIKYKFYLLLLYDDNIDFPRYYTSIDKLCNHCSFILTYYRSYYSRTDNRKQLKLLTFLPISISNVTMNKKSEILFPTQQCLTLSKKILHRYDTYTIQVHKNTIIFACYVVLNIQNNR